MIFPYEFKISSTAELVMKTRICLVLFITILLIGSAQAQVLVLRSSQPIHIQTMESSESLFTFRVQVGSLTFDDIQTDRGIFTQLVLDDSGTTRRVGAPQIPVIRRFVRVPFGAKLSVSASGQSLVVDLADYSAGIAVLPVQPPVPKMPGALASQPFVLDEPSYLQEGPRFTERVQIVETGMLRGHRFAVVEVRPVDYNPVRHSLTVYPDLQVKVTYEGADWEATNRASLHYRDVRTDALLKGTFINPNFVDTSTDVDYPAPGCYLVVGPSYLLNTDPMAQWIQWKTQKGYDVVVADQTETGGTAESIRNFVQDAYFNWDIPPSFLLLVGDTVDVPHFIGTGSSWPATDLYYSTVDGGDYFADLGVGRFPARHEQHLTNMVDKTLAYEMGNWSAASAWLETATFMASKDRYEVTEGTHNDVCSKFFEPSGIACEKLYYKKGATTHQVLTAVNQGRGLVTYSGHGSVTGWADGPPVNAEQIYGLINSVYPFVSSFACVTGEYTADECFSESWLRVPHGAVAMWASSVSSLWDEDDMLERGQMWGIFVGEQDPVNDGEINEIPWFSGFCDFGKNVFYLWASKGNLTRGYFEMYNIMGDPETSVWTTPPSNLNVEHESSIGTPGNAVSLTVSGADFITARVGISADGRLLGAAIVQPDTKTTITLFETIAQETDVTIMVTARNVLPYTGLIRFTANPDDDDDTGDDDDNDIGGGGLDDDDDDSSKSRSDTDDSSGCGC